MIAPEVLGLEPWHDFFILVGTGSATLAGLVFVAMTISLRGVEKDATHRYRAINMLAGFTSVFIFSSLALFGDQTHRSLGVEWLLVSVLAAIINTHGYIQAYKLHGSLYALNAFRMIGGSACYTAQILGSLLVLLGYNAGITIAALAIMVNMYFFVSGSWLLVVGSFHHDR